MTSPDSAAETAAPSPLDRAVEIRGVSWLAAAWVVVLAAAVALRFGRLDQWALAPREARVAFAGWLLYRGQPAPPDFAIPAVGPLPPLLAAFANFLFGSTDAIARLPEALFGLALVALPLALIPVVGRWAAFGMALLAALSPTLLYSARSADGQTLAAALALALVVCAARAGLPETSVEAVRRWAIGAGVALAALFAVGPSGVSVIVALAVGFAASAAVAPDGAIRQGLRRLAGERGALASFVAALVATLLVLFSRFFSDPAALVGLYQTIGDWFALLAGERRLPPGFFLLALFLYEPVAIAFAIVGHALRRTGERALPPLLAAWFVAALLLWSFTGGAAPDAAVHVALPLALLGGGGLGLLLAQIDWDHLWRGRGGLLALAIAGAFVALAAVGILLGRVDQPFGAQVGALPAALVAMLALMPLLYAVWRLTEAERADGHGDQPGRVALLLLALLLGAFGLRSAILLSFDRAGTGTEMLARNVPTGAVRPEVDDLMRLSRDVGVLDGSVRDPTGSHSLGVAIDERVQWPWRWYFREFPDASVQPQGAATTAGAEVVISPDEDAVSAAGYAPRSVPNLVGVPEIYRRPDLGGVLRRVLLPTEWVDGVRFLLYREGVEPPPPSTVAVGLNADLAAKASTAAPGRAQAQAASGPYALADRPGPGSAEGQFDEPVGVATARDGTIYVVDSGNARVERFDAAGAFLGAWGKDGGLALARVGPGLGATGIAVGPDGRVYVADTWNHRVVALDQDGAVQMDLGGAASPTGGREAADNGDDPANVNENPGAFFGPRSIAVSADAIYVTDTGNERVQVFTPDGAFVRAFGGFGSAPGRLIEPVGVALGPDGNVYVADSGNARVAVFTPQGEPVRQIPVATWPPPDPTGTRPSFQPYLTFASDGTLYASASDAGSVVGLAPDGAVRQTLRQAGNEQFDRPVGVATSPEGELLVSDVGANAVLRLPLLPPLPPGAGVASPAEDAASPAAGAAGATPASGTIPAPPEL